MKVRLTLAAAAIAALVPTLAAAASWVLLGSKNVRDRVDYDEIVLAGHRTFSQIKLCVQRHPVRIYNVDVYFNNGGNQDIELRERIGAGSCSRVIDLDGGSRDIARIRLVYEETSALPRTATVNVYGMR